MLHNSHFQRKRLILNMINHLGPISRTALIEHTAYRPATVGAIVTELLEQKLVIENGFHSQGQGRKRALLEINKKHICAVGIYFSSKHITYVLSQFDGDVIERVRASYSLSHKKDELILEVTSQIESMLSKHTELKFVGIGICKPLMDPISYKNSKIRQNEYVVFANWIQDELKPHLHESFSLPVEVFSGVTLPAQAEYTFGVAKGVDNFIWIELSNGIGTSIFCNGDAVRGANGMAGELGHIGSCRPKGNAKLCYCGKPDCVESVAAWPTIKESIVNDLKKGVISKLNNLLDNPENLTVDDVRKAIEAGDRVCKYHVKNAAELIGTAIADAVTLLNPKMLVLYGFMLDLGDYFFENLERTIRENVVFLSEDFEIRISTVSESIMPLGAAANIFFSYLRCNDYKWVYQLDTADVDTISEAPFMY